MPTTASRATVAQCLVRGGPLALLAAVLRVARGLAVARWEWQAAVIDILPVAVFVAAVAVWAFADGRALARGHADTDGRADPAMWWLLGGMFAGVVGGFGVWLISLFVPDVSTTGLLAELTTTAAIVALLVFFPAIIAVFVAGKLVDRATSGRAASEHTGPDVFDAVQDEAGTAS